MKLRHKKRIRSFNRILVFTIVSLIFFVRTQIISQITNTILGAQTSEYSGGLVDDVQYIRCYHWFRQCKSLISPRGSSSRKFVVWSRVKKNMSAENCYAIESSTFYDTYLYVHKWDKSSKTDPVSDLAISKDLSIAPLRVLSDIQELVQSSDSSVFHKHVYQQKASIWDRFSWRNSKNKDDIQLSGEDWKYKGGGIWLKYQRRENPLIGIEIYLGAGFVESRPMWRTVIHEYFRPNVKINEYIPISITRKVGTSHNREIEPFDSSLHLSLSVGHSNSIKILQITDVHFRCSDEGTTLLNEFQTVNFITNAINKESPDLVLITGDFLDGPNSFDYQTCILKLVQPMIQNQISYAFSFGLWDYSTFATETELTDFISNLPFCMNKWSSADNHMAITIKFGSGSDVTIYVLNSLSSVEPFFIERERLKLPKYSLAFRHLPISEYRPDGLFPLIGKYNERSSLQSHTDINQNMGAILRLFHIMAMSCGYEHNNDCCLKSNDEIWLCYGGSSGVGLKRMSGMAANVRIFRIDDDKGEITSWKRNFISIDSVYDYQFIKRM